LKKAQIVLGIAILLILAVFATNYSNIGLFGLNDSLYEQLEFVSGSTQIREVTSPGALITKEDIYLELEFNLSLDENKELVGLLLSTDIFYESIEKGPIATIQDANTQDENIQMIDSNTGIDNNSDLDTFENDSSNEKSTPLVEISYFDNEWKTTNCSLIITKETNNFECDLPKQDSLDSIIYNSVLVRLNFTNIENNTINVSSKMLAEYTLIQEIVIIETDTNEFIDSNTQNVVSDKYSKIQEDEGYDVNIISFENVGDDLVITFNHDGEENLPILIEGNINYELDKNSSSKNEVVVLRVFNWNEEYFRIYVGENTEVFEFGTNIEIEINSKIVDAKNNIVDAEIEFIDSLNKESKKTQKNLEKVQIEKGKYDLKILFNDHPIKEINLNGINVYERINEVIQVDKTPKEASNIENAVQSYSINPKLNEFSGDFIVNAKGNTLYKCKDWDFSNRVCNGEWVKIMNLTIGEDYTVKSTPALVQFSPNHLSFHVTPLRSAVLSALSPVPSFQLFVIWCTLISIFAEPFVLCIYNCSSAFRIVALLGIKSKLNSINALPILSLSFPTFNSLSVPHVLSGFVSWIQASFPFASLSKTTSTKEGSAGVNFTV